MIGFYMPAENTIFYAQAAAFFGAALAIGLGVVGPAIAQGLIAMKACENLGKYPESQNKIRSAMIIGMSIVETCALYPLFIAIALVYIGWHMMSLVSVV